MSIATLKRKTQAQYNNISVGQHGFSLNGTHRSQGYVGQTSLSRSLPRTPMNGPYACGYGGKYVGRIIQSAVTSLNDPTVVKNSVITNHGMLDEKLHCITNVNTKYFISCGPTTSCYNTVKPDNNQHLNEQNNYITLKAKKAIKNADLPCNMHIDASGNLCKPCKNRDPFFFRGPSYDTHTKPTSDYVPISQGEYLINKSNSCTIHDIISVPKKTQNTPFGCGHR
jgi:hypothetical protein